MTKISDELFSLYVSTLRDKMKKRLGDEARFHPLNLDEAKKLWKAGVHPDHAWDGYLKDKSAEEIIKLHKSGAYISPV